LRELSAFPLQSGYSANLKLSSLDCDNTHVLRCEDTYLQMWWLMYVSCFCSVHGIE